jgi:hypothetical protein
MILPYEANPGRMEFSEMTAVLRSVPGHERVPGSCPAGLWPRWGFGGGGDDSRRTEGDPDA